MTTHLTDRFFLLFGLIQFLGCFSPLFVELLPVYILLNILLIVITLATLRSLPRDLTASTFSLLPTVDPELHQQLSFKLTCRGLKKLADVKRLVFILPQAKTVTFKERTLEISPGRIAEQESLQLDVPAESKRLGFETLEEMTVLAYSNLNLALRRFPVKLQNSSFRVHPRLIQIPAEEWSRITRTQRLFAYGNRLLARHRGQDRFYTIRKYQPADSLRHVDARKSAKFDTLMTRVYDTFSTYHLISVFDLGRTMFGRFESSEKYDYYLSAILNITKHALENQDTVSFLALAKNPLLTLSKVRNISALESLYRGELRPRDEETQFMLLPELMRKLSPTRGILLIFTDLSRPAVMSQLTAILPLLSSKHLVAVVSLADRQVDYEKLVLEYDGEDLNAERYAEFIYSGFISERVLLFQAHAANFGSGALNISDEYWLSAASKLYSFLRNSYASG
jgi:uncharacterized protein (DUF58 family)